MPTFTLCEICSCDRAQLCVKPCGHRLHGGCASSWPLTSCPSCGEAVEHITLLEEDIYHEDGYRGTMRNGRWTVEEERYSEALIDEFTTGRLPLSRGFKLAHFLADVLGRTPAGIRRKFLGCKSILYGGFQSISGPALIDAHINGQKNFRELESFFLISLSCQSAAPIFEELNSFFFREWQAKLIKFCSEMGQKIQFATKSYLTLENTNSSFNLANDLSEPAMKARNFRVVPIISDMSIASISSPIIHKYQTTSAAVTVSPPPESALVCCSGSDSGRSEIHDDMQAAIETDDPYKTKSKWKRCYSNSNDLNSGIANLFQSNSMPTMKRYRSPRVHILAKKDEEFIEDAWKNQHTLHSRTQRIAFDKSLFDQACSLIYNYKALKIINADFDENAVVPLVVKLLSACSNDSTIWFMNLKNNYNVTLVTDGVSAMGIKREDVEGKHVFTNKIMKVLFHPNDKADYFRLYSSCQETMKKVVEEATINGTGIAPFHENIDIWLHRTTKLRYRYDPLKDGWADMVINGYKAPDRDYNCLEEVRCFCTDKFWLCMDNQLSTPPKAVFPQAKRHLSHRIIPSALSEVQLSNLGGLAIPGSYSPDLITPHDTPTPSDSEGHSDSFTSAPSGSMNKRTRFDNTDDCMYYNDKLPVLLPSSIQPSSHSLQRSSINSVDEFHQLEEDPNMWHVLSNFLAKDDSSFFA